MYIYELIDSRGIVRDSTHNPAAIGTVWTDWDRQPGMTAAARINHVRRVWIPAPALNA